MRSQKKSSQRKIEVKFTFLGGFEFKEKVVEADEGETYSMLLEKLGINPETVIIVKGTEPVPIDSVAVNGEIKVLRVISGGSTS